MQSTHKLKVVQCCCVALIINIIVPACNGASRDRASTELWERRTAHIEDSNGNVISVRQLHIVPPYEGRECAGWSTANCVTILTDGLELSIPLKKIVSVAINGHTAVVSYVWMDKQLVSSGMLPTQSLKEPDGPVAFRSFRMSSDEVRAITFDAPPGKGGESYVVGLAPEASERGRKATLVLTNGIVMACNNLKRYAGSVEYSRDTVVGDKKAREYMIWREYYTTMHVGPEVQLDDGGPLIRMVKLSRVDYGTNGLITVTYQSGYSGGKVQSGMRKSEDGFCGYCDRGLFFMSSRAVRSIEFEPDVITTRPR